MEKFSNTAYSNYQNPIAKELLPFKSLQHKQRSNPASLTASLLGIDPIVSGFEHCSGGFCEFRMPH